MPLTRTQLDTWCESLRANPDKQHRGTLFNSDLTKACCLGELILCTKQPLAQVPDGSFGMQYGHGVNPGTLSGAIRHQFGSDHGLFIQLAMPDLGDHATAATANDSGVPWPEIADHFQKYYQPCEEFD